MKVCLTLICLFFLTALQDGDAAETKARMEGENITVECRFNLTGNPIIFCKENCEGTNILINTTEGRAHKDRYSTFYESEYYASSVVLHVSISELKRSDSGRYRCGLGKNPSKYQEFHLDVTAASSSTTIQQTTTSFQPNSKISAGQADQLLYVGLGLPILIILLATALLIYCQRKRFHQQKGPVETDPTDLTINAVYEEIREEDRENKPPAGEISSVYVSIQPNKPNAAESNVIYSLASEPQRQAKEEEAAYSEVQLLNDDTGSSGGHVGVPDNVTYSEPQLDMSSGSHGNGSPALYSTISLEQELC